MYTTDHTPAKVPSERIGPSRETEDSSNEVLETSGLKEGGALASRPPGETEKGTLCDVGTLYREDGTTKSV